MSEQPEQPQVEVLADKISDADRDEKGRFKEGNPGSHGRPVGSKNKFTLLKEDIVDLWQEENGKEKLRAFFNHPKTFFKVLDTMVAVLPKEAEEEFKAPKNINVFILKPGDNGTTNIPDTGRGNSSEGTDLKAQASGMLRKQSA